MWRCVVEHCEYYVKYYIYQVEGSVTVHKVGSECCTCIPYFSFMSCAFVSMGPSIHIHNTAYYSVSANSGTDFKTAFGGLCISTASLTANPFDIFFSTISVARFGHNFVHNPWPV